MKLAPRRGARRLSLDEHARRLWRSLGLLGGVTVVGTVGYLFLGLGLLDSF